MSLEMWPNTAIGCNHQSTCMPKLQPCSCTDDDVLPRKDEGSGQPNAVSKPYSTLAPTQDSNPGGLIQNHKR